MPEASGPGAGQSGTGGTPAHAAPRRDPDDTLRVHAEDPAEGPDTDTGGPDGADDPDAPRVHPQDPAEG